MNAFSDIYVTLFVKSVIFFSASTYFVLFEVNFLFKFFSLSSKSVFFIKAAISFLLTKYPCVNLAGKLSDANLLNSWVVIYLSWSHSVIFFFQFY